jgi:hypothetical protein
VKEIALHVVGFKAVYMVVTDTLAEVIESGGPIPRVKLSASREGISIRGIPALDAKFGPMVLTYAPENGLLGKALDSVYPPAVWGAKVAMGLRAAQTIRKLLRWMPPSRGRGRPKRGAGWDLDREEFFALMLRYSDYGEPGKVTKALTDASADHSDLFERAFSGEDPIEAARQYFYRRMKEFKAIPDAAIPLGRILSMRFEFESDYI